MTSSHLVKGPLHVPRGCVQSPCPPRAGPGLLRALRPTCPGLCCGAGRSQAFSLPTLAASCARLYQSVEQRIHLHVPVGLQSSQEETFVVTALSPPDMHLVLLSPAGVGGNALYSGVLLSRCLFL